MKSVHCPSTNAKFMTDRLILLLRLWLNNIKNVFTESLELVNGLRDVSKADALVLMDQNFSIYSSPTLHDTCEPS